MDMNIQRCNKDFPDFKTKGYNQEFIILEVEESVQLSIQQPNTLR